MNITELARILKITPQELRNNLPRLGFHIGQKAIKINKREANKIIKDWPNLKRKIKEMQEQAEEEKKEEEKKLIDKDIKLCVPKVITVKEFAAMANVPLKIILGELIKNGIFSSLNEKIDYETAWLIGTELGMEVTPLKENEEDNTIEKNKLETILKNENEADLKSRPPVIVVMGHVDHGKTKLLDAIRKTDVVASEAGGITQHIGAYQITRSHKLITFIDTPGHEAFTAMRSRGAKIADIAILVVAADDGVKPQTVEAFRIIEAAKIPYVVAINKTDKPSANIDKVKQELSQQLNITPEDWGGKTVCLPISALKNTGITELLDMVLLVAEAEAKSMRANPKAPAMGTIIESNIDKGAGPIATILVQNGTMKMGNSLVFNNINIGKVRCLNNYKGQKIKSAGPATPVQIIGLKIMPQVGDVLSVGVGKKIKHKKTKAINPASVLPIKIDEAIDAKTKKINLIIKSDVLGSTEAIENSLEKINTVQAKANILHKGLGNISDGDIKRIEASGGKIIGFNVKVPTAIGELAREKNIEIKLYSIIYDLINDIKKELQGLIEPDIKRVDLGTLKIKAIFKSGKEQILGAKVTSGKIEDNTFVDIMREKEIIGHGKITSLQAGKQTVREVEDGQDCGLKFTGSIPVEENDQFKIYKEEKIINKI